MGEIYEYVEGVNDGRERTVCRLQRSPEHDCDDGYVPVLLHLEPGKWVMQIVEISRIKRRER